MKAMNGFLMATIILTLDTKYLLPQTQHTLPLAPEPLPVAITSNEPTSHQ